jgi:2-keto-4-pentenoate hydratase
MEIASRISAMAARLHVAEQECRAIAPIAGELGLGDIDAAYSVQAELTRIGLITGRRLVGRKIGLTSRAVQAQFGVDQPDYGALFADMEVGDSETVGLRNLIQPRVEAEVAFVLERHLIEKDLGMSELVHAVAFALPALEIVDSRIADWKISIVDTIADNGSSARFVLGLRPRRLTDLELETCGMVMTRNGVTVSVGSGAACLGHPLRAALWLAKTMVAKGEPLRAGDVVLTGALGPMCAPVAGDRFEARIGGLASVAVQFE